MANCIAWILIILSGVYLGVDGKAGKCNEQRSCRSCLERLPDECKWCAPRVESVFSDGRTREDDLWFGKCVDEWDECEASYFGELSGLFTVSRVETGGYFHSSFWLLHKRNPETCMSEKPTPVSITTLHTQESCLDGHEVWCQFVGAFRTTSVKHSDGLCLPDVATCTTDFFGFLNAAEVESATPVFVSTSTTTAGSTTTAESVITTTTTTTTAATATTTPATTSTTTTTTLVTTTTAPTSAISSTTPTTPGVLTSSLSSATSTPSPATRTVSITSSGYPKFGGVKLVLVLTTAVTAAVHFLLQCYV